MDPGIVDDAFSCAKSSGTGMLSESGLQLAQ